MRNVWRQSVCLIAVAVSVTAADQIWKSKPAAQWTEEEARQVLASSPWAKEVRAVVTRRLTEEQLRETTKLLECCRQQR